jgi:hypothetical protein
MTGHVAEADYTCHSVWWLEDKTAKIVSQNVIKIRRL